ncbi:DUF1028 domain-containing protein [Halogranum rubrum]|uniref:DUF1028 domain-containing protein n=1 Tax=Halogranum salarium B-1 TaxID=1210908 RepID=J3JCZ6_9EURY|nr:DUF1028 domain-containing protein [Halogranum salarium]EJN57046.1 hypothetical protein HSB1_44320 [Halogranum salarium B-1]
MTFSICVREETDDGPVFGVAVATDAPAVGALAPCISHDGVISTQSFVNVRLGRRGIELLPDLAVDDALSGLLTQDDHRELRQVHGIDFRGNAYAFSGDECDGWFGHEVHGDEGITVAGNMLANGETLSAAVEAYRESDGQVGERLVDALAAGKEAGGDKRGHTSAALKVKAPETTIYHDLRVDEHETPIAELRRVYESAREASEQFTEAKKSRIFD